MTALMFVGFVSITCQEIASFQAWYAHFVRKSVMNVQKSVQHILMTKTVKNVQKHAKNVLMSAKNSLKLLSNLYIFEK